MKTIYLSLISLILVTSTLGCSRQTDQFQSQIPSINVQGEGSVVTVPDEAMISFGVISQEKTLEKAYADNTSKSNEVIRMVKKMGVSDQDLQTSSYSVSPVYNKDERGRNIPNSIAGFQVSQMLSVKVRDLAKIGDLIDKVIQSGTNDFNGIQFLSSKSDELEKEAKAEAAKDAKENAELLAKSLGVKLGKLLHVSQNVTYPFQPKAMMMRASAEMSMAPQIQAGSMEISAMCSVQYEIKQ